MGANLFVASFLGCLIALVMVVLLGSQIAWWLLIRYLKKNGPDIFAKAMHASVHGTPPDEDVARMYRDLMAQPPGATMASPPRCMHCHTTDTDVPNDVRIAEALLRARGWRFIDESRALEHKTIGWWCPVCVAILDKAGR